MKIQDKQKEECYHQSQLREYIDISCAVCKGNFDKSKKGWDVDRNAAAGKDEDKK